jgi:hypothetical protein
MVRKGVYRHYKGGTYQVLGMALHSETQEQMVVYFNIEHQRLWVRPAAIFTQTLFDEKTNRQVPRFQFLGETYDNG